MEDLTVLVRDKDRNFIGQLEYETLELILRHNALGSWSVEIDFDGNLDTPAGYLLTQQAGIAVIAPGGERPLFSGPVTKPIRVRDGDLHHLSIGGTDDLQWVADRLAHQDPNSADVPPPSQLFTYDTSTDDREGPAESVIKDFVRVNASTGAIPSRQTGLSIFPDLGRGLFVEEEGRQQNLLDLCTKLATAGAVGFRALQFGSGNVVFDCYEPQDKTNQIVFSIGLGNIARYEYSSERPTANVAFVGGSGTGASRIFQVVFADQSIANWGRVETFVDESSSKVTKLQQAGRTELESGKARFFFSADAVDTGSHRWAPLNTDPLAESYDLGDIVKVDADGQTINEVIRELHVVHDATTGLTVTPIVGSTDQGGRRESRYFRAISSNIQRLRVAQRDLQRR